MYTYYINVQTILQKKPRMQKNPLSNINKK